MVRDPEEILREKQIEIDALYNVLNEKQKEKVPSEIKKLQEQKNFKKAVEEKERETEEQKQKEIDEAEKQKQKELKQRKDAIVEGWILLNPLVMAIGLAGMCAVFGLVPIPEFVIMLFGIYFVLWITAPFVVIGKKLINKII